MCVPARSDGIFKGLFFDGHSDGCVPWNVRARWLGPGKLHQLHRARANINLLMYVDVSTEVTTGDESGF